MNDTDGYTRERGLFARLGQAVVRHPWRVIALWVVAAAAVILTSPGLPTTANESSFLPKDYESIRAMALQDRAFPQAGHVTSAAAVIVFSRADGGRLTAADSAKVAAIAKTLAAEHIHNIVSVTAGPASPNRLVQTAMVAMPNDVVNGSGNAAGDAVKALRADIRPLAAGTGLAEGVTGQAAQDLDSQQSSNRADQIVLIATLGLILVLLLIIFRSPVIALLPLLVIAVVAQVATGLISDVNKALSLHTDSSISTILIVVLFGIGTDYILFLMFRYRERLRRGEDRKQAMVGAVARVGEVISSAAGVVIFAFLALALSTVSVLRSLGPALAIAVAVTLLAGLTLVPAVVSLLGPKVFWPSTSWRREPGTARFGAIGNALGRRPALFAGVSGLVMVALAIGAFGFRPTFDLSSAGIPASAESQRALVTLEKGLPPGATDPTDVLLHSSSGPLSAARLADYGAALKALRGVGSVAAPALSADRATADYRLTLSYDPSSTQAVAAMKNSIRPGAHAAAPPGTYALVGGTTAVFADIQRAVNHDYAVVFPVAAVIILLILGLLLRSAVAPWYLLASVGLGFGATLGASVLVFQVLGGQPGLVFLLPVYMYLFVVALGTDYNILMIARLREEAREGRDARQAAAMALRHTGPAIGAAGLILAGTFASLMLAGNTILSQVGFAVSCGIALAAFVMALFFSPSLTALIGHRAWWPGHGDQGDRAGAAGRARARFQDGALNSHGSRPAG
ncbi:MAG TPA: MMPL family transporter [Streptosporangiaceae bacterium]|nr:MMPL family transporter [Streptosporangiaceae bacterium]